MNYGTAQEFFNLMNYQIDNYDLKELMVVSTLTEYCSRFPLQTELSTLSNTIQDLIIKAIYIQMNYMEENELFFTNGESIANTTIGDFSYSKGVVYQGKSSTGVSLYSKQALILLRLTGLVSFGISYQ